ncbi:NB-ARC domain containing protein [Trema orientale]|uniref:NB-ARC domain containing protein n=1 Tax=Trema orientale TaxID=63057 RepID=A0A2P5DI18_TREOI|nr:NB-ARC domain containing protein [Trema orientale]
MADLAFKTAGTVLVKLGSIVYSESASAWGLKDDLKKLQRSMAVIKTVLQDAEEKQARNRELSIWLTQLKDVILDAQDVLDQFECQVRRREVVRKHGDASTKARHLFSHSNPLALRLGIGHEIKETRERLDDVASDRVNFNLTERHEENRAARRRASLATQSFINTSGVWGRDGDRGRIYRDYLLSSDQVLSVIPIHGVEGIGKTTLALLVFNHNMVKYHFEERIWVSVSDHDDDHFDVPRIMRDIVQLVTNDRLKENLSSHQLATRFRECLRRGRFLLVLDDVSNLDHEKWSELTNSIETDEYNHGSKIIVTTRKMSVASIVGTVPTYELQGLSQEDCWRLFLKSASKQGDQHRLPQHLEAAGRQIVENCQGNPLVVKVLGRVFSKLDEGEWKFIRDNEMWKLDLWMANRVLESLDNGETSSTNTKTSSGNLISLFKDIDDKYGLLYLFCMHDLVNDLVHSVSQTECSIIDHPTKAVSERVRHLSVTYNSHEDPDCLNKLRRVRTILFPLPGVGPSTTSFLDKHVSKLNYLRVLDLSDSSFEMLPSYVGEMMLLRYLNLSRNVRIKSLPDSICKLQSLETLELAGCSNLEGLPRDVKCLESLTFLSITTTETCFSENKGIGCLGYSLQTLVITNCKALISLPDEVMRCLTKLETLMIINCEKLRFAQGNAEEQKKNSNSLSLQKMVFMKLQQMEALPRWLLRSSSTLQCLRIEDCPKLTSLPQWLPRMALLQGITIENCENLSSLPEEVLMYLRRNYNDEYSRLQLQMDRSSQLMQLIQAQEEHGTDRDNNQAEDD